MSEFVSLLGLINYGFVLFFGIVMSLYLADIHFEDNKIPYIITILALGAIQLLSYLMMGEICSINAIRCSYICRWSS